MDARIMIEPAYAWHGRLMVLAWSVLLPLGIFVARYLKVTPTQDWPQQLDRKLWWHSHLVLQISGVLCMSLALGIAWAKTGRTDFGRSIHVTLGWFVVALAWLQLLGGYLRGSKGGPTNLDGDTDLARIERGDHYDMTPRRLAFEWVHKIGGYGALALSVLVTGLGLELARAPAWMWLTISLWWVMLLGMTVRLQRAGRCIDTYQAIWGPDLRHPGNATPAIGWGIHRYTAASYRARFDRCEAQDRPRAPT
jgi:ABC-type branched-subunit amino acid transport system permease subunit